MDPLAAAVLKKDDVPSNVALVPRKHPLSLVNVVTLRRVELLTALRTGLRAAPTAVPK